MLGQFANQWVDLPFGAHIDAARWIEEQQRFHACCKPPSNRHLLLVATRQTPYFALRAGVDLQTVDCDADPFAFASQLQWPP